jgi:hypothetical protein
MVNDEILYMSGQWSEECGSKSSNNRELANLVNALEKSLSKKSLDHAEIFLFTDNSAAESVFFKGTSKSPELFNLVLRLQEIHMRHEVILHIIHVSGRGMIAQGTDGLSRGQLNEGVFAGYDFLSFVPLHLNAFERQPLMLEEWLSYWLGDGNEICWLSPED